MTIYTTTLGFCNTDVFRAGMKHYYATAALKTEHYFLYNHYPRHKEQNRREAEDICREHGLHFVDGLFDRGLGANTKYLFSQMPLKRGDIILGYDPDARPDRIGWDRDMVEVLNAEKDLAMLSVAFGFTQANIDRGYLKGQRQTIAGHDVFIVDRNCIDMIDVSAWRWETFQVLGGGLPVNNSTPYYGHNETPLCYMLSAAGLRYGYMLDHVESTTFAHLGDPEYQEWKRAHLEGFKGSFAQYLEKYYHGK